jgi:hypothetical protein
LSGTWPIVLPVIQKINNYGGNFISAFLDRSVFELADGLATEGDPAATASLKRICHYARTGNWPQDPAAFNAIFEAYRAHTGDGQANA